MRIVYRPAAISDLRSTSDYIACTLQNPKAAQKLREQILRGISRLRENPFMGVSLRGRLDGFYGAMRVLIVGKQLVFYEVQDETVEIIRILDGRTDYLSRLFEEI